MNTDGLAKLYDRLKPAERLPLIVAAVDRGDAAEADRLARSAPRIDVRLPDYHGLGEGLLLLSLFHTIGQLERGLTYWHIAGTVADWEAFPLDKEDKDRAERLWGVARMTAYQLCVEADAWTRLCAELQIDPATLLRDLPCYDTLQRTLEAARLFAGTPEEATAYLRELGRVDAEAPTVEAATRALREFLDQRVAWWGGGG
jgi:hypothetical protein